MITVSLVLYPKFYFTKVLTWMGYLFAFLFALGFLTGQTDNLTGRYQFGFVNPNEAGAIAAIGFGIFLMKEDLPKWIRFCFILLFTLAIVLCGSRSAVIFMLLALIFKYKLNTRLILVFSILIVFVFFVMPYFNFSIIGFSRVMDTYDPASNKLKLDRESEYLAGYLMFLHKFWTGYGLSAYRIIDFSILPPSISRSTTLGTHNGYICAAKMYGIFFLIPFLYAILVNYYRLIRKYFSIDNNFVSLHLFIITVGVVGALTEDYFIGVNSLITVLALLSFSVLQYNQFIENNSKKRS